MVVFHDSLVVFDRPARTIEVTEGTTTTWDARVQPSRLWGHYEYWIAGTVRDAQTDQPVARAYVEPAFFSGGDIATYLVGMGLPEWTITDDHGRFSIAAPIAVTTEGEEAGLLPITITRSGYESYTLAGEVAYGVGL